MEIRKAGMAQLLRVARTQGAYVGGSNRDFGGLVAYMCTKTLEGFRVEDLFDVCMYAHATNVMGAEDRLLQSRPVGDPWNVQKWSNCEDAPGFVYVLVAGCSGRRRDCADCGRTFNAFMGRDRGPPYKYCPACRY